MSVFGFFHVFKVCYIAVVLSGCITCLACSFVRLSYVFVHLSFMSQKQKKCKKTKLLVLLAGVTMHQRTNVKTLKKMAHILRFVSIYCQMPADVKVNFWLKIKISKCCRCIGRQTAV